MVTLNYVTLFFKNKDQEERFQSLQMDIVGPLITHIVVCLFVLNLVRIIIYAADGKDDAELIGGLILMLVAPVLKCLAYIGQLKRPICVACLIMTYITIVEWSLSFDDLYGYQNRTLWVYLVVMVAYQGALMFTWNFLVFFGVTFAFSAYALFRTYAYFGDLDLPACVLSGLLPMILSYVKHFYYRNMFDFADGQKEEARYWQQAVEHAPQGIVVIDKDTVHYHNKIVGSIFGVADSEPLYNMFKELKQTDQDESLIDSILSLYDQKGRAESIYCNKVESLGIYEYSSADGELLEYEIMGRFIIWQQKEVLILTLNDITVQNTKIKTDLAESHNRKLEHFVKHDVKDSLNVITANLIYLKSHVDPTSFTQTLAVSSAYESILLMYMSLYCVEDFLAIQGRHELKLKYEQLNYFDDAAKIIGYMKSLGKASGSPEILIRAEEGVDATFVIERTRFRQILAALLKYVTQRTDPNVKTTIVLSFDIKPVEGSEWCELHLKLQDQNKPIELQEGSLLIKSINASINYKLGPKGVHVQNGCLCCSFFVKPCGPGKAGPPVKDIDVRIDDDELPMDEENLHSKLLGFGSKD